jgi:hypothetical protein
MNQKKNHNIGKKTHFVLSLIIFCITLVFSAGSIHYFSKDNGFKKFHGNKMMVITHPKYRKTLDRYLKWKKKRGLKVSVDTESALKGADAIKDLLQKKYDTGGLTYIVIVGDIEDVPSPYYMGAPSDPSYALLEGDDYIGDALVSRISVKTIDELKNQLQKIIMYEKGKFKNIDWIDNAIVVGTHEFDGIAHTSGIADVMKKRSPFFKDVIQILENDPHTHSTLLETIEKQGANMIVYNSHGSEDGFHNIIFTNDDAPALKTFNGSFPFIHGAGCSTGSFQWSKGDCFAETMLKIGTAKNPYGPIAMLAFSRSANPGPAMMAQREAFKNLYFNPDIKTFGELCFYSNLHAMKNYNDYEAEKFYKHWHLFGDCSTPIWKKPSLKKGQN